MTRVQQVTFPSEPPVGLAVAIDGQRFDLVAVEPHQRRDGNPTRLLVWQGECATCGEGFTCRSITSRLPEVRRCSAHRQPGVKVRKMRGKPAK